MIGLLWDVIAMLRILANEVEDPEAGGEIWPMVGRERIATPACAAQTSLERRALPARRDVRNDAKEARA